MKQIMGQFKYEIGFACDDLYLSTLYGLTFTVLWKGFLLTDGLTD